MPERTAVVERCDGTRVALRARGACSDCGGCGGRCNVFAAVADGERIELDGSAFGFAPAIGDAVKLTLADGALGRLAWQGYGLLLAGLLAGAALGRFAAAALASGEDAGTLAGAVVGLTLALHATRRVPAPALRVDRVATDADV